MHNSDRVPPQNLEAERNTLGCQILIDPVSTAGLPELMTKFRDSFSSSYYYSDIHQIIQNAIWSVRDSNDGAMDAGLLCHELQRRGVYEEIGGAEYVASLMGSVYSAWNVLHHAAIVTSHWRRRESINIARDLLEKSYDMTRDDQEVIESAHDSAMKMAEMMHVKKSAPRLLSDHSKEFLELLQRGESLKMFWGIPTIDNFLNGVEIGALVVIAARSSHGKTLVALQWLDEASKRHIPGLIISLEMTGLQLMTRTAQYLSEKTQDEWRDDVQGIESEIKTHFENRAGILVAEHCSTTDSCLKIIERAIRSHGVKIVAVDYAQMIDGKGETRAERVGDVSKRLKRFANKHEIIIILLAQLNREVDKKDSKVPSVSDIKDSSSLEHDADIVLLPYSPVAFDRDYERKEEYRIICGKHRNGSRKGDTLIMKLDAARQRILPVESGLWDDGGNEFFQGQI